MITDEEKAGIYAANYKKLGFEIGLLHKVAEESSELTTAILQYCNKDQSSWQPMLEEIVDVEIMIDQLR